MTKHTLSVLVEDKPGVTRDRHTREVEWCGHFFNVIDTGGWMPGGTALDSKVSRQVEAAAREADLVLFLVDATNGLVDDDESIAAWLRTTGRPILLVANKVDGPNAETDLWQFLSLGLGDAVPVSAIHGRKSGDLLDAIVDSLELATETTPEPGVFVRDPQTKEPRVAIVGRPNVGKSTLFNRLVGEERSIVHDLSGTTRDAIDVPLDEMAAEAVVQAHRTLEVQRPAGFDAAQAGEDRCQLGPRQERDAMASCREQRRKPRELERVAGALLG